jgi:hypothetical protein
VIDKHLHLVQHELHQKELNHVQLLLHRQYNLVLKLIE